MPLKKSHFHNLPFLLFYFSQVLKYLRARKLLWVCVRVCRWASRYGIKVNFLSLLFDCWRYLITYSHKSCIMMTVWVERKKRLKQINLFAILFIIYLVFSFFLKLYTLTRFFFLGFERVEKMDLVEVITIRTSATNQMNSLLEHVISGAKLVQKRARWSFVELASQRACADTLICNLPFKSSYLLVVQWRVALNDFRLPWSTRSLWSVFKASTEKSASGATWQVMRQLVRMHNDIRSSPIHRLVSWHSFYWEHPESR